jgi:hypothetical protein
MGYLLGIGGNQNTGKSYSRKFLKEEAMVITCNTKSIYLTKKDTTPVDHLQFKAAEHETMMETLQKWEVSSPVQLASLLVNTAISGKATPKLNIKGNYVLAENILHADVWLKFVSLFMPHIKVVIFPDFTHYITETLTDHDFLAKGQTKQAFERYVELAATAFNAFFKSARVTRKDLIQVIEFHLEFDENAKVWTIFTPGGKMLKEKFKPESYFDVFLVSTFIDEDEDKTLKYGERFKFVTRKMKHFDARSNVHDPETEALVPNDLQDVISRIRKAENL